MTNQELAAAIRRGKTLMRESKWFFLRPAIRAKIPLVNLFYKDARPVGCALGMALVGHIGVSAARNVHSKYGPEVIPSWLGISLTLAYKINHLHMSKKATALEIADMLERNQI